MRRNRIIMLSIKSNNMASVFISYQHKQDRAPLITALQGDAVVAVQNDRLHASDLFNVHIVYSVQEGKETH